jgi:hypothetical protein
MALRTLLGSTFAIALITLMVAAPALAEKKPEDPDANAMSPTARGTFGNSGRQNPGEIFNRKPTKKSCKCCCCLKVLLKTTKAELAMAEQNVQKEKDRLETCTYANGDDKLTCLAEIVSLTTWKSQANLIHTRAKILKKEIVQKGCMKLNPCAGLVGEAGLECQQKVKNEIIRGISPK